MAFLAHGICSKCGKDFTKMIASGGGIPTICSNCEAKETTNRRLQYLKGLEALTVEERLKKIEKWIYDYKSYSPTIF